MSYADARDVHYEVAIDSRNCSSLFLQTRSSRGGPTLLLHFTHKYTDTFHGSRVGTGGRCGHLRGNVAMGQLPDQGPDVMGGRVGCQCRHAPSHRSHRWSSLDRASIQFLFECVPGKNPDRVRTIQEIMGVGSSRWGSLRVAAAWEVSARLVGQVLLRATDSASTLPWPQPLLPYAQAAGQRYIPTGRSSFLDAAFLTHVRALDNHIHQTNTPVRDGTAWFRALAPRQLVWTFLRTGVVDAVQVLEALLGSALVRDMVLVHVPHPVDTARVQGHHPGWAAGMAHGCLDVPGSKTPHIPHAVAILEVRECDHDHDHEHEHEHEHPNPYTNDCKRTSTDKDPVRYVLQNWWVGDEVWVVDTQWLHRHQCSLVWVASLVPAAPITARNWSDGHANQNPNLNPTGVVESLLCS